MRTSHICYVWRVLTFTGALLSPIVRCVGTRNCCSEHLICSIFINVLKSLLAADLKKSILSTGDCGFLAANLYARSIFGEDALANVSVEKPFGRGESAPVTGHIRIRAKSQGMALSLGDKINIAQKNVAAQVGSGCAF